MKKTSMTVALALVFGAATSAVAQQAPTQQPQAGAQRGAARQGEKGARSQGGDRGERRGAFRGERGGPGGMLLRGITLTDAQKTQLKELRSKDREANQAQRTALRAEFEAARKLRQSGDTAGARAKMEQLRARGEQERQRDIAAIRNILTAEQRATFDANVTAAKQRQAQRPQGGKRGGERRGR
jgi:Spy/CpxP family protein refolding chaperone